MSVEEHQNALERANAAVAALYGAGPAVTVAAAAGPGGPVADPVRADAALNASAALTDLTAALLADDDPNVQEVGVARLGALAARDFAIAHDLVQLEGGGEGEAAAAGETSALAAIEPEIAFVLAGNPTDGLPPDDAGGLTLASRRGQAPRAQLADAAPKALRAIRDDAASVVEAALGAIQASAIAGAIGALASGIFDRMPDLKSFYDRARHFVLQGIAKLRAIFGELFDAAIDQLKEWLGRAAVDALADTAFGIARIEEDIAAAIGAAPDNAPFASIRDDVLQVADRLATHKKVARALVKATRYAGRWLVNLLIPGAGEPAAYAVYGLSAAYGIFVGGDYMDWHVTRDRGAFDFVVGVRRTVQERLGPYTPAPATSP